MARLADIQERLKKHWGFDLEKCQPNPLPRWKACWNTGYMVNETFIRFGGYKWYRTLKEIEREYLE